MEDNNVTYDVTCKHEGVSVYVCTYMHMHVEARRSLPFLKVLSTLFFYDGKMGVSLVQSLLRRLEWLAREPQGSVCPYLCSTRIASSTVSTDCFHGF